jgi:hypothetical protein
MSFAVVMSIIKAQQERREQEELDANPRSSSYSPIIEPEQISRPSEPEPRDVYDICKQIMDTIPDSEVELLYQLRKFYDTLWNQAPELRRSAMFWKPLGNILNNNIQSLDQDWQKKVLKLFNAE